MVVEEKKNSFSKVPFERIVLLQFFYSTCSPRHLSFPSIPRRVPVLPPGVKYLAIPFSFHVSESRSHERTPDELEVIYEELIHITALSHLSNSVKRELASVIVFEAHTRAGTVRKCRPDATYPGVCILIPTTNEFSRCSVRARRRGQILVHNIAGIRRCRDIRERHRHRPAGRR